MSRNIEFHNQLGLSYGPAAPTWDRSQESLVRGALGSWDGDPFHIPVKQQGPQWEQLSF